MNDFQKQVWASVYGATYVRFKLYRTIGHNGSVHSSALLSKRCAELAADEANRAVRALPSLKESGDNLRKLVYLHINEDVYYPSKSPYWEIKVNGRTVVKVEDGDTLQETIKTIRRSLEAAGHTLDVVTS